jgi:hypothetical protein
MKNLSLIIIFLMVLLNSCQDNYIFLPEKYNNREELLKKIIPNKKVQYWQIDFYPNFQNDKFPYKLIFSKGKYDRKLVAKMPTDEHNRNGFFSGCQPIYCNYRITYLENNNWKTVDSEELLKDFIGEINNEYEAFLIAKINDYNIDSLSEKGNGYLKTENGYQLKVVKYESCPESKESFTLFIDNQGNLKKTESNGYYLKTKNCIVY